MESSFECRLALIEDWIEDLYDEIGQSERRLAIRDRFFDSKWYKQMWEKQQNDS